MINVCTLTHTELLTSQVFLVIQFKRNLDVVYILGIDIKSNTVHNFFYLQGYINVPSAGKSLV